MNLISKTNAQKGETNMGYIVVGILIAIGVFFAIKYFHDRNNDITIHMPKIEVH